MDLPQQREVLFLGNPFHAADEPQNVTAFPTPQHPQPAHSSGGDRRPLPGQPRGHPGVLQDAVFPGNRQPNEARKDMPPPVEDIADQAQPQYVDIGYYDMANDYPPPQGHHDHIIGDNARIVQDVPAQFHVAPPALVIGAFNDDAQQAAAGPAPPFLGGVPHQDPVLNGWNFEVPRQLALHYLSDPKSQLTMVRMGPSHADEVTVDISLKLTNHLNGRASEVLRQLALLYLSDPNSQLTMFRMGHNHADEVTVDISLNLTNL